MLTNESCLPWEPIPARFAKNWQIGVAHMEESSQMTDATSTAGLSVAIVAHDDSAPPLVADVGAWRIDFDSCAAYRVRIVRYAGSAPLTQLDAEAAFWEIAPSNFAIESGALGAYPNQSLHHFVILSDIFTAYELIASSWHCQDLGQNWARQYYLKPWPFPGW